MGEFRKESYIPIPLQCQLDELTVKEDNTAAKMLSYNRANRAVAVLCNHQVGNTILAELKATTSWQKFNNLL